MHSKINFGDLLMSVPYDSGEAYESAEAFEDGFPYIGELRMSFAFASDGGEQQVSLYDKTQYAKPAGVLSGVLLLGKQAYYDGENFARLCDDYSGDLCVVATELKKLGVYSDPFDMYYDILVIHSLELSRELVDATNLGEFFDRIPRFVFHLEGVKPDICCNIVANIEGYYEEREERTSYDRRSAGKDSIRIFAENGFRLTESKKLLFRLYDEDVVETQEDKRGFNDVDVDCGEKVTSEQNLHSVSEGMKAVMAAVNRHILEDHIQVGIGTRMAYVPRDAPKKLTRYVYASIVAYDLGTTFDYALDYLLPEEEFEVPLIHLAFQEMYYAGMQHMDNTLQRMNPQAEPTAGEVFSDAALCRARNTYYVAALLYREGHMIEAHAMSRLMLEQIAWSFAVAEKQNREEADKVSPTKAIGDLKKKIKPVGKLYGVLSQYVHLPLKGHGEFVDVSGDETAARVQFGAHSYYFGQILAYLADYWAGVYEYTQARHFDTLDNWIQEPCGLALNPNRPFIKSIEPLLRNLNAIYAEQYPSYKDFIDDGWMVASEDKNVNSRP